MTDSTAPHRTPPGLCSSIELPGGRKLDVWQAGHCPTLCRHRPGEHLHLTLLVDSFGRILDELLGPGG